MSDNPFQLHAVTAQGYQCLTSVEDAAQLDQTRSRYPLAVYTAFRSYGKRRFLNLADHLLRLRQSMRLYGLAGELAATELCRALEASCAGYGGAEMKVRVDVLDEAGNTSEPGFGMLISLSPFVSPPRASYKVGVAAVTTRRISRSDAQTKTARFVSQREEIKRQHSGVEDILLLGPEEQILEGTSSNFYGVKNEILYTAGEGMLEGTTRRVVLRLARVCGFQVVLEPVNLSELSELSEAGISSASRGIMPVTSIDEMAVGSGKVGPVMETLIDAYEGYVTENLSSPSQGLERYLDLVRSQDTE